MVIVAMRTQTLPLMRMKAGNSGKRYGVLIQFIMAEWLSNVKSELLNLDREEDIIISQKDLKKML